MVRLSQLFRVVREHSRARWVDVLFWAAVAALIAPRVLPQIGAATGVGGTEGESVSWSAVTLDGDTLSGAGLTGQVVVINFWATWCPPCQREMPALQRLWDDFRGEGLVVVGLSTDVGDERRIRNFLAEGGFTFPVARATTLNRTALGGITGVPTTLLVDQDGRVRHRIPGYTAPPIMRRAVERLLAEAATYEP